VVEVILERVTSPSMGSALGSVTEFEELAVTADDAPAAFLTLHTQLTLQK
jgi:tartronate-semialdehyde synthase